MNPWILVPAPQISIFGPAKGKLFAIWTPLIVGVAPVAFRISRFVFVLGIKRSSTYVPSRTMIRPLLSVTLSIASWIVSNALTCQAP